MQPERGELTVDTIDGTGAPVEGQHVVFHDASGLAIAHVRTDLAGLASAVVEPNAMATVASCDGERYTLRTVAGAQPSQFITIHIGFGDVTAQPATVAYVSIEGELPGDGYTVLTCSTGATDSINRVQVVAVDRRCLGADGTFAVVAYAYSGATLIAVSSARATRDRTLDPGSAGAARGRVYRAASRLRQPGTQARLASAHLASGAAISSYADIPQNPLLATCPGCGPDADWRLAQTWRSRP